MLDVIKDKLNNRKHIAYGIMALICLVLGFGLTLQIRSVYKINKKVTNNTLTRAEDLQTQLTDQEAKNTGLNAKLNELQKTVDDYREKAAASGDYSSVLNKQLDTTEILAGLKDVHGPGVTVTMKDSSWADQTSDPDAFIIHDTDILQVLNELRDAGVDALSLNDERILATSEIRCAGNTVSVNNNRYAAPFVIKAIGDPEKLKSALLMKNGIVDVLTQWGIVVDVAEVTDLKIKAYDGTPVYKFATPYSGQ